MRSLRFATLRVEPFLVEILPGRAARGVVQVRLAHGADSPLAYVVRSEIIRKYENTKTVAQVLNLLHLDIELYANQAPAIAWIMGRRVGGIYCLSVRN